MRTVTRTLPVLLTAEEKVAIMDQINANKKTIDIIEGDKRAAIADANSQLKPLRKERERLFTAYDVGAQERPVECMERPKGDGTIEVVRLDTGEVVGTVGDEGEEESAEETANTKQPELPFARPGKACEGCSNADGTHHPECVVAHPAKAGADDELEGVAPPPDRLSTRFVGVTSDGRKVPVTEQQAADCASGKNVFVREGDVETEIFKLAKIPQPSTRFVGVDSTGGEHAVTEDDVEAFHAGSSVHVSKDGDAIEIRNLRELAPETAPAESEEAPDYSAAAEVAAEQIAKGEAPEREVDEAIAKGAPVPKRKRGGASAANGAAE